MALGSQRTAGTGSLIDPAATGPRSCPHLNTTNGLLRNQPQPDIAMQCLQILAQADTN